MDDYRNHRHNLTTSQKKTLSKGMRRLLRDVPLTEEERGLMKQLAYSLDRPMPKHACKTCWLRRVLDGKE